MLRHAMPMELIKIALLQETTVRFMYNWYASNFNVIDIERRIC